MEVLDQPQEQRGYLSTEEVLTQGYRFDLGTYLGETFNILFKHIGTFGIASFIAILISFVASLIPFVSLAASLILTPLFSAGLMIMAQNAQQGKDVSINDLFAGFRQNFSRIFVSYLIIIGFSIVLVIVMVILFFAAGPDFDVLKDAFLDGGRMDFVDLTDFFKNPAVLWGYIPLFVVAFYLGITMTLTIAFATFHHGTAWDAVSSSFRIVKKAWGWFFLYAIILGILTALGVIALIIGIIFTYALSFIGNYVAFDHIMSGKSSQ